MRVYVLGPMTGFPEDNRPAFRAAARLLRRMGYQVVTPDELDLTDPARGLRWEDFLMRDVPWVVQAEMGVALPGWRNSRGATLEAALLGILGKPVNELIDDRLIPVSPDTLPIVVHPTQVPTTTNGGQ